MWSVFIEVFKRIQAASLIGVEGILALKRAVERLWRPQGCLCAQLCSRGIPKQGVPKTEEDGAKFHSAVASKILIPEYSYKITEIVLMVMFFLVLFLNLEGYLYLSCLV